MAKKQVYRRPLLRFGGGAVKGFGFDTAALIQGYDKGPLFIGDGILDLFVVIAAVGQDDNIARAMGTHIVIEIQMGQISHDALMFGPIHVVMIKTVALTVKR